MKISVYFFLSILLLAGCDPNPVLVEETCNVTVRCDSNGTVSPTAQVVPKGENVRIYINPFIGFEAKTAIVNGQVVSVNNILDVEVNFDTKVTVIITQKVVVTQEYYKVFVSCKAGGTISPSGEITLKKSEGKNYTISMDNLHLIDSLLIDGKSMDIPEKSGSYSFTYKANDTLKTHTINVIPRDKKVYTVKTACDEWSVISGNTSFYEGGSTTLYASEKNLRSLVSVKANGVTITGKSYTFTDSNPNPTFETTAKQEPEWFLCRGTWSLDSSYINNTRYIDAGNIKFIYYSNGVVSYTMDGKTFNSSWSMNKKVTPMTITQLSSSAQQIMTLNESRMVLYIEGTVDGEFRKVTEFYHNTGTR